MSTMIPDQPDDLCAVCDRIRNSARHLPCAPAPCICRGERDVMWCHEFTPKEQKEKEPTK